MYKETIRPWLDGQDSETWHVRARELLHITESNPLTLRILERFFTYKGERVADERLKVVLGGVELENPLLVGAGWDKQGRAVKALWQLGFAGVEVGSVLAFPQEGNPKPRQFMLTPGVALNRLGFNSPGMEVVARNLKKYHGSRIPIGISIGKNKNVPDEDTPKVHAYVASLLYEFASYFVINVSSPNTPGLRKLQDKEPLMVIVQAVNRAMSEEGGRKPLFVKIAPDLTDSAVDDVIQVVIDNGVTGIIATNTTNNPEVKARYGEKWRNEAGGLSGEDPEFRRMATEKIAHIYKVAGNKIEIIGVGGVNSAETALEKMQAGAKVIQIVTGIRGEGTTLPGKINRELIDWMDRNGIKDINQVVGSEVSKY